MDTITVFRGANLCSQDGGGAERHVAVTAARSAEFLCCGQRGGDAEPPGPSAAAQRRGVRVGSPSPPKGCGVRGGTALRGRRVLLKRCAVPPVQLGTGATRGDSGGHGASTRLGGVREWGTPTAGPKPRVGAPHPPAAPRGWRCPLPSRPSPARVPPADRSVPSAHPTTLPFPPTARGGSGPQNAPKVAGSSRHPIAREEFS